MRPHLRLIPILPVRDLAEARAFWSATGLVTTEEYDAGYAFVRYQGAEIAHLALHPDLDPAANRAACYVHIGEVDELRARFVAAGLPASAVRVEPWGMREFRLSDPSGNLVRLGAPV